MLKTLIFFLFAEKTERVLALEVENEVLRKGQGDGVGMAQQDTLMVSRKHTCTCKV
jgi:hypothetical protein